MAKKELLIHGGLDTLALKKVSENEFRVEIGLRCYGGVKGTMYMSKNQIEPLIKFLKKASK